MNAENKKIHEHFFNDSDTKNYKLVEDNEKENENKNKKIYIIIGKIIVLFALAYCTYLINFKLNKIIGNKYFDIRMVIIIWSLYLCIISVFFDGFDFKPEISNGLYAAGASFNITMYIFYGLIYYFNKQKPQQQGPKQGPQGQQQGQQPQQQGNNKATTRQQQGNNKATKNNNKQ